MNIDATTPPRKFLVGISSIELHHCANIRLSDDEMVTFFRASGAEYDFASKSWGFYVTPSINGRLADFGFRTAIVVNLNNNKVFIFAVESGHEKDFYDYLGVEHLRVWKWVDEMLDEILAESQ